MNNYVDGPNHVTHNEILHFVRKEFPQFIKWAEHLLSHIVTQKYDIGDFFFGNSYSISTTNDTRAYLNGENPLYRDTLGKWTYHELKCSLLFFTENNQYSIQMTKTIYPDQDGDDETDPSEWLSSSLRCAVSSRKSNPGESCKSGHELMNGIFCEKTFDIITKQICANELIQLSVNWKDL